MDENFKKNKNVVCNHCHWVHFEVSAEYVKDWQEKWKAYWPTLTEEGKQMFKLPNGPPNVSEYTKCHRCGGSYKNFSDATEKQYSAVYGSTIPGILSRNETVE